MDGNEAEELRGVPYTTSLTQHLHYPSPTQKPILRSSLLNMETEVLAHLNPSQGLHYNIPHYHSQEHLPNTLTQIPDHRSPPNTSSYCNNNNSDEAKAFLDDQKRKRMFSNRESARRSRMRKKQQIAALQYHVDHLQTMNDQLFRNIINLLECNQQILQQNDQLKEKLSSLQVALSLVPLPQAEQANFIPNGPMAEHSPPPVAGSDA